MSTWTPRTWEHTTTADTRSDAVAGHVRALQARGVSQLDALEVLIGMAWAPGGVWTAPSVSERVLLGHERVAAALAGLVRVGAVRGVLGGTGETGFALSEALDLAGLRTLARVHAGNRIRIVNAFFACKLAVLRATSGRYALQSRRGPDDGAEPVDAGGGAPRRWPTR